ncbi:MULTISPECIES: ABC transporter ATP-binding protein [Fervidicoccus]|uniref:Molybdate/tungstate import ATP-binding protein WtpC n=1 Tax=Fervidicoccus fontis (strain DSM 19380 / JCM 18336 / VKM B-2539 / Kam940) TaxID=1163730 RepID=I0A1P2_FERFK|nr:ATP-binding cassette domain-containing protein [Fervidicoccus fontis]AFH42899.1 Nitrate transport ATP-binding protein [Fervidicoccus fontis Kam940]
MDELIAVRNLTKSFSDGPVISNISFKLNRGEVLGIMGPNGCGKTTMLRTILGLENKDSGEVKIRGKIGYVPQDNLLLPWLKLRENIVIGLKISGAGEREIEERLSYVSELLSLNDHLDKYPNRVSGGTARKASIARALIIMPDILILDEPYTGLDSSSISILQTLLKNLKKEIRLGIIIVSHQVDELMEISDRIIVLTHRPARIKDVIEANKK